LVRPLLATLVVLIGGLLQPTDLDQFMARALQRRDIDRKTLADYVLDEVETFEVLAPGKVPVARMRREYTWYVRDGIHVRSPVRFDGVPISEADRRAYEDKWLKSEENRRKYRTERDAKREAEGKGPALSAPSINEPRFVSESYFMDFKFEPGNYYLAGKETIEGKELLKIDYLPTKLFDEGESERDKEDAAAHKAEDQKSGDGKSADENKKDDSKTADKDKKDDRKDEKKKDEKKKDPKKEQKEKAQEDEIERKMDKTSQVTLWVDPQTQQIVKYTFDNVWLDFLPGGWLVKIDDLRASMQMGQPFPGVWLPHSMSIHAGVTVALGSMELQYHREFSNFRKADVSTKVKVPKGGK
jgi:hypothetical protein